MRGEGRGFVKLSLQGVCEWRGRVWERGVGRREERCAASKKYDCIYHGF